MVKKNLLLMVKGSRENEKWYNQLLVIRDMPSTDNRQVSWLADQRISRLPGFPVT